jgi:hypothetical protein
MGTSFLDESIAASRLLTDVSPQDLRFRNDSGGEEVVVELVSSSEEEGAAVKSWFLSR